MELIKPHHKPSERVRDANEGYELAKGVIEWLDANQGKFPGNWDTAVAISHCQVSDEPRAFFVLGDAMVAKKGEKGSRRQNRKNWYFPGRAIFNAEIIEAPETVERMVPKQEIIREQGSKEYKRKLTPELKEVSNLIEVPDACMSYPRRTKKNTRRYHTIKVRYQVLREFWVYRWFKTITEEVDSFKAHVFQHEIDHAHGIDMYFGDGENSEVEKPYANAGCQPAAN
jgi:hypothetical protein